MKICKKLESYLKSKRLFASFERECEAQSKMREPINNIGDGFLWFNSIKGNKFWSDVNAQYIEAMKGLIKC